MRQVLRHAFLLLLITGYCLPVLAQERILSFHSDILIAQDASMEVTETIRVVAQGDQIRRGIYRDFPTDYRDNLGNRHRVGFEVIEVKRDGFATEWNQEKRSNGERVYIMNPEVFLAPGEYEFQIRYRTNRQLGFFEDHDELYWNVTGNGWAFAIEEARATVSLPQAVSVQNLKMEGYTGVQGSRAQDYSVMLATGQGTIASTALLPPAAGLTLVLSFPKGIVLAPDRGQQATYVLKDNRGLLLGLLAVLGSAGYLFLMWQRHGRDPKPGVVFPHYEPPEGFSPAAARYLRRMSYDNQTFTSAVVSLAVKGRLTIDNTSSKLGAAIKNFLHMEAGGNFSLHQSSSEQVLAPGEAVILDKLFSDGPDVELNNKNHRLLQKTIAAHKAELRRAYHGTYFKSNGVLLLPSLLGALAVVVLIFILDAFVPLVAACIILIIVLHVVFGFLMHAPSTLGRQALDKLDGFKDYLEVAEKQDLQSSQSPQLTPQLFERFLPYATPPGSTSGAGGGGSSGGGGGGGGGGC